MKPPRLGRRRGLRVAAAAMLVGVTGLAVPRAEAADAPAGKLYVRRTGNGPRGGVEAIGREIASRGATHALVVFDAISLAPPPGVNEWTNEYRYRDDLAEWLEALTVWAATSKVETWIATTRMERPLLV